MNGIRVVSDGISFISEGNAQHEDIIYDNTIKSNDNKTTLTNNHIDTEIISCNELSTQSLNTETISADSITGNYLVIKDPEGNNIFVVDGKTNEKLYIYNPLDMTNTFNLINAEFHQTQTGRIYQQGTGENYLKDTKINGYLTLTSNLTQSGGSARLLDLKVGEITQTLNTSITQSGDDVSNAFAGTT